MSIFDNKWIQINDSLNEIIFKYYCKKQKKHIYVEIITLKILQNTVVKLI